MEKLCLCGARREMIWRVLRGWVSLYRAQRAGPPAQIEHQSSPSSPPTPFSPPGMSSSQTRNCWVWIRPIVAGFFLVGDGISASEPDAQASERLRFFEARIRPVLVERCEACHSQQAKEKGKLKAGLFVDSKQGLLEGGDSGPALVPGKPSESLLLRAMRHESKDIAMPPKEAMLSQAVLTDFARWITDGAADPRESAKPTQAKRRGMSLEEGRGFWAMRPPVRPAPAQVRTEGWALSEVDRLILAGLEREGLRPAPDASPEVVLRRLHLDLTGLPPSAGAVASFRMEHLEAEVDKLLASRSFGERWGRHWLDVARYADSNGRDRNVIFHHAWRYRDYVVDAFAADKPLDVFIREQIAGDLLAGGEPARADELRVATGFLALGSKAYEETKPEVFRMDLIDEQIELIGRGILGLSVACARCHDHKFDAIPTADYYALAGIFRSTEPLYGYGPRGIKATAFHHTEFHALGEEGQSLGPAGLAYLRRLDAETLAMHTARSDRYRLQRRIPDLKRKVDTLAGLDREEAVCELAGLEAEIGWWNGRVSELEKEVACLQDSAPPMPPWAMGARDREKPEDARIHIRGETTLLGDVVPRGFLRVVNLPGVAQPGGVGSGRLELAGWLTHRENPLTARVYVNRVWRHLFGRGLVTTPDDFGVSGAAPTHPELLDFLAVQFMEAGWSTKRLVRSLVLSRLYRLDGSGVEDSAERDPDNRWFGRMRPRLAEAEVLHDSLLSAAGALERGRPPLFFARFHPYRDAELSAFKPFVTKAEMVSNHRAVYLPVVRGVVPDALLLFDFASPDRPVAERTESILPTQALYFLKNPRVTDLAARTAQRSRVEGGEGAERVVWIFRSILGRTPRPEEIGRVLAYVDELSERGGGEGGAQDGVQPRWADVCQMLFASVEHRLVR